MLKNVLAVIFHIIQVNGPKMTRKYDKSFMEELRMIHALYSKMSELI